MPDKTVRLSAKGIRRGMVRLAPLALFVIPFGMAYAIAAIETGLTSAQAIGASLLVFSGAAQFAVLDLWGPDMSLVTICLVTAAVSARHLLMGAALSRWVNPLTLRQRLLSATFLSDANFADMQTATKAGERDIGILVGGGLIGWMAWVLGTAIGAFGGAQLGDPRHYGIDMLMPVYFAALVVPGIAADRTWGFVAVAALVAILTGPVLPTGWNIILAAIAGGIAGVMTDDRQR